METRTVYILDCSDGKIYVGCTNDIDDRLIRHNGGEELATRTKLPVKLLLTFTRNFVDAQGIANRPMIRENRQ